MPENRECRIEYINKGVVGHLYLVMFLDRGVRVGQWPINEGLGLALLIQQWIVDGVRPY